MHVFSPGLWSVLASDSSCHGYPQGWYPVIKMFILNESIFSALA